MSNDTSSPAVSTSRRNVLKLVGAAGATGVAGLLAGSAEDAEPLDDCMEDIQDAQEYAEGQICTEQYARMQCPYDEEVTYGAANGCEISYLKEQGWDMAGPDDGTYTAVIDRFEADADGDRLAVLLLEDGAEVVGDYLAEASLLPEEARHENAVLDVTIDDAELVDAEYLEEETEERKQEAQDRFDQLSERPDE